MSKRRWCLLFATTAAVTLLGAGASQAQTTGTCAIEINGQCFLTAVTPVPSKYPQPAVAYYNSQGALLTIPTKPSFAYDPTKGTLGWYGAGLPNTWPAASTAAAQVLQSSQTTTLRGAAATTSTAQALCPPDAKTNTPMPITGLKRYANQYGYTAGIRIECTGASASGYPGVFYEGTVNLFATIGQALAGQQGTSASCAAGAVGNGFSIGAGEVMDNVSLECAVTGSHSPTPILGPGVRTATALCPKGHALTGLQGLVNDNWLGSVNVIGLTGICTQYPTNSGLGAAGGGVVAYKGTSPKGAVKFSLAPKQGTALGAGKSGWDYTLGGFQFAKACSRASAKVPGKVAVFGRESAGKPTSFSLTSGRFSVTGRLSGALSKPKVSGTMKILDGACKGKRLRFAAKPSR